jgi:hypothetical protein
MENKEMRNSLAEERGARPESKFRREQIQNRIYERRGCLSRFKPED